jgi:heterodisulfide reductase subunit C
MSRAPLGAALRAFLDSERERILATCTSCGKCYEACPMPEYVGRKPAAKEIVSGVLSLLREGKAGEDALAWVNACIRTGECVKACPENVNPKMMMRLAKMTALGGMGGQKLIVRKEDPDYFNRIRAFGQLQLSDDEVNEWMR